MDQNAGDPAHEVANLDRNGTARTWVGTAIVVLSWAVLAAGLLSILLAMYASYLAYGPLPIFDAWAIPDYLATHHLNYRYLSWYQYLWAPHNEHRIPLAKLFLFADWHFFRGRDIFTRASTIAVRLLDLGILAWALRRLGSWHGTQWRTAVGIAAFCLFSLLQQSFFTSFQIVFMLLGLFVDLTLILILLYSLRPVARVGWKHLVAIMVAATAATFSLAAGILIWPVLLLTAIWVRIPKRVFAMLSAGAIVVVASYLYHYQFPPGHGNPLTSLHHPVAVAEYAASYLGAPWQTLGRPLPFGCLGLALATVLIGRMLWLGERKPLTSLFGALLFFGLSTSMMTALGRLKFGSAQASSPRYESVSLIFWLSLALWLLHFQATRRRIWFAATQAILLVAMVFAGTRTGEQIKAARSQAASVNSAALAILASVFDRNILYHVSPDPEWTWRDGLFLRQHHLSIFATALARHLNESVRSVYQIRKEDCWGQLLRATPVGDTPRDGLQFRGWAWDPVRRRPVRHIVLVAGGRIIGYGQPGFRQPNAVFLVASRSALYSGWLGYIKTPQADTKGTIYGVVDFEGKCLCQVDGWPFDPRSQASDPLRFSTQANSRLPSQ